ncbi:ABC transporter permease [Nocardiopsis mangrovi]|uniref:ABC transporter permease n=1 Tax=Nocardiopsis mangrovi TaxID=1179818 RepID=A0ABV9E0B6_9ACTN
MRVYLAVFACGLRRYSGYRAATAAGIFTNSVFGLINATVLLAVFSAKPEINGYDAVDAVTHVYITQALIGPVAMMGPPLDLASRIRTGEIAVDLLRPAHLTPWWLAHDLGRAAFNTVFRGVPTLALGLLVFPLALPGDPLRWAAGAVSLVLAVLTGFGLRYLFALAGFWLMDSRGLTAVATVLGGFGSGMLLPLVLYPEPLATLLRALPWSAMVQVPVEILLGTTTLPGGGPLGGLAFQAAWALGLLALSVLLTERATRRVVVQGG